jgi:hypothetical protein
LRGKLQGRLHSGFDPEILVDAVRMGLFYVEGGIRKFVDFAKMMLDDLGDGIRPYLKSIYNGIRGWPGHDVSEMTPHDEVEQQHAEMLREHQASTDEATKTGAVTHDDGGGGDLIEALRESSGPGFIARSPPTARTRRPGRERPLRGKH